MTLMRTVRLWAAIGAFTLTVSATCAAQYGGMRNGTFGEVKQRQADDPNVVAARKAGWKLPPDLMWPAHWEPNPATPNGSLDILPTGGITGSGAVRLSGGGHIASYFGLPEPGRPYIASIRVKGHGRLWFGAYHYSKEGFVGPRPAFVERDVQTDCWVEYRGLFPNGNPDVISINVAIGVEGVLDIDEVNLTLADPADVEIVKAISKLYGTSALVENLDLKAVKWDAAVAGKVKDYREAVAAFRAKRANIGGSLFRSMEKKVADLAPYLQGSQETLLVRAHDQMVAMTRVLRRLAGQEPTATSAAPVTPAPTTAADYKPGVRAPRPGRATITDVRSNKVRYDENETARTRVTVVNTTTAACDGVLIALMHLDIDTVREIARTPFSLAAGATKEWNFSYNVGPETYGRAIEVKFVDGQGKVLDRWEEYYAVAAEYFRVQQHSYEGQNSRYPIDPWVTYYTQRHYFANEPTDWGVSTPDVEVWDAGQTGWRINKRGRRNEIDHFKSCGVTSSFYQTFGPCGLMGYEVLRKHPEYALYDANGQFAVDPIYGGYPNPMEIGSPMEVGPKRKVTKPYLDRKYTPWQHTVANFAMEEAVVFQSNCIKRYAEENGFDGVYIDGTMGVFAGYGYDGKPNVPSGKPEDYARLNARNHRIFSDIVKRDNSNFGTWYNWGGNINEPNYYTAQGHAFYLGGGVKGDVSDAAIRAAASYRNVMFLCEMQAWAMPPEKFLETMVAQRDFVIQRYEGNSTMGYNWFKVKPEDPGPSKWGWPTVNYMGAILIATQMHHAGGFTPSFRPTLQFQTRYSRLLWAPDIKVVPVAEVERSLRIVTPEEVWWKRLVYRRQTADGYDLIVHVVRIPPTKEWDIEWVKGPPPLEGAKLSVNLGSASVSAIYFARPYHFEEDQQTVQAVLKPTTERGAALVEIPPFQYHAMVVFRVKMPQAKQAKRG